MKYYTVEVTLWMLMVKELYTWKYVFIYNIFFIDDIFTLLQVW